MANAGVGTYRVEQMLFGKTKTGREFVISIPEYTFAAVGPKIAVPEVPAAEAAKPADAAMANASGTAKTETETPAEPPAEFPLGLVIGVNLLILIGGGAAVLGSIQPQPLAQNSVGEMALGDIAAAIKPMDCHFARTRLLALENTWNGYPMSQAYLAQATAAGRRAVMLHGRFTRPHRF